MVLAILYHLVSIYHFLTGKSILSLNYIRYIRHYTTIVCFMFSLLKHDWMAARLVLYCPSATWSFQCSKRVVAPERRYRQQCMASEQGLLQLSVTCAPGHEEGPLLSTVSANYEDTWLVRDTRGTTHPAWTPAISPEILLDDQPTCLPWCHLHVLDMLGMNE